MDIAIIGAGISGLTTALCLEKQGFQCQIFEQAEEIMPVGAGIILAHNAMQVFTMLGLSGSLEQQGNPLDSVNILDGQGMNISTIDVAQFNARFKAKNTAIHRSRLQSTLLAQLDSGSVHLGKSLTGIEQGNTTQLTFSDGSTHRCDLVIGADGIHSKVRESLHDLEPAVYRNAHQLCWRGVADTSLEGKYHGQLNEMWGDQGSRFGFVSISDTQVYWYALVNDNLVSTQLHELFSGFAPIVMNLIEQTDHQKIFQSEIKDLATIKHWFDESLVLVGDAAHATTPNLGQGACQGVEDAYVLARCLAKYLEPNTSKRTDLDKRALNKALGQYQQLRITKAHYVVNTSWQMGKVSQWQHPVLAKARNTMFRLMPDKLNHRQSLKLFTLADV